MVGAKGVLDRGPARRPAPEVREVSGYLNISWTHPLWPAAAGPRGPRGITPGSRCSYDHV